MEGKNATPGIRRGCSHDSDWTQSGVDDKKCSDHFASLIVAFPCDNSKLLTPTPRYKNKTKKELFEVFEISCVFDTVTKDKVIQ